MKKSITAIALLMGGLTMAQQAEIVNGFDGFESWVAAEVGELPEYWDGFNKEVIFNGMTVGSVICVQKDNTDPYEGNYSAKITSTSIMGGQAVPGILTTGDFVVDWNAQDGDVQGGEAYTQLPTELIGQFKYNPVGADTAFVSVWFLENGVEVGGGRVEFDHSTTDWTEFNVPIVFSPSAAPDSMNIMFSSTKGMANVPEGSTLEVDAISFQSFLSVDELKKTGMKCYPNPSSEHFTIELEEVVTGELRCTNSLGQVVFVKNVEGDVITLDSVELPQGNYQLTLSTSGGMLTQQVVIN